jgi:parvulin-like peptidyl-prolyl isomerase
LIAAGLCLAAAPAAPAAGGPSENAASSPNPAPSPAVRASQGIALDGIAAVVNSSVITYLDVQDPITLQLRRYEDMYGAGTPAFVSHAKELLANELEARERGKLILDDFNKGEYTTNWVDDEVEAAIKRDIKENYNGSRTTLIKTLQAVGRTYEDYRRQQRENIIVMQLAHLHGSAKIIISPAAIAKYYEDHKDNYKVEDQVKLRTIRIAQPPGGPAGAARELAAEILAKIDSGVPFAEMAKVYSSDEHRAAGGDWGWMERKALVSTLRDAAASLTTGQHSPIVESRDERTSAVVCCYLLLVEDVRPAHDSPLAEVQDVIERTLEAERSKELEEQWIRRLKAKSFIETF